MDFLGAHHRAGREIAVSYLALLPAEAPAGAARWCPVDQVRREGLPLDHGRILDAATERLDELLQHTTAAVELFATFTVTDLRRVYETLWQSDLDPPNFQRRFVRYALDGAMIPTGDKRRDVGRPAKLYRPGPRRRLNPPLRRPDETGPHLKAADADRERRETTLSPNVRP